MTTSKEALRYYVAMRSLERKTLADVIEEISREYFSVVLIRSGNNQSAVAERLGLHRNTVRRHLDRLRIVPKRSWRLRKPV